MRRKTDSVVCFNYECGFWKENNICAYGESLMYERPCWNDGKEEDDEE